MSRPTRILILGRPFTVEWTDDMTPSGEMIGPDQLIRINTRENTSQDSQRGTLIHEIIHAVLYASGTSELMESMLTKRQASALEEAISIQMETALTPLIRIRGFDA